MMNEQDQIAVIENILLAIAPAIATRALDKLSLTIGDPYSNKPAAEFEEVRGKIFDVHAKYAIEIASRLVGKFAQLKDATTGGTQAQNTLAKDKPGAGKSVADLLSQPSGVSSEALKLRAMREAQHRGPSQARPDRAEIE
jgi:hypothetical protein